MASSCTHWVLSLGHSFAVIVLHLLFGCIFSLSAYFSCLSSPLKSYISNISVNWVVLRDLILLHFLCHQASQVLTRLGYCLQYFCQTLLHYWLLFSTKTLERLSSALKEVNNNSRLGLYCGFWSLHSGKCFWIFFEFCCSVSKIASYVAGLL